MSSRVAIATVGLVLLFIPRAGTAQNSWYNGNWSYRKQITINYTMVSGGTNLTGFPVLINLGSDADLAANAKANGDDILFTSADGTTKLSHEIETYASATGALVAWVKVPTLSATTDTVLYMYYGNASASSQQDAVNTWDSSFKGVWHLKESPAGTAPQSYDSTSYANNGTSSGSMTAGDLVSGKDGNGLDFDGVNDVVGAGSGASLDNLTTFTYSAWVFARTGGGLSDGRIVHKGTNAARKQLQIDSGGTFDPALYVDRGTTTAQAIGVNNSLAQNQWQYVTATYDPTDGPRVYVNGVEVAYQIRVVGAGTTVDESAYNFYIGNRSTQDKGWDGVIDEVRVANVSRSIGWMTTEYNNQNAPGTFYGVGFRETPNDAVRLNDTTTSSSASASSLTFGHTVGTGTNRLLLVGVSIRSSATVSSVTYNGVTMQQVTKITNTGSAWLYKLLNPPSGTANVVVTLSGSDDVVAGAVSFDNVEQGAPLGAAVTASGSNTAPTVTVQSRPGDMVMDVVATQSTSLTVNASQTQQWNILQSTRGGGSTAAGVASVAMSWTTANANWAQVGVSVRHVNKSPGSLVTGTYTGDNTDNRAIANQVGFEPDLVVIKAAAAQSAAFRTVTMNGDLSKLAALLAALTANIIQSFDAPVNPTAAGGFTIGTDAAVNSNGVAYEYVAMTAKAGEVFIGSYLGDGVDSRNITGVGFQPGAVWIFADSTPYPVQKTSSMAGDTACDFSSLALTANIIQAMQSDGFQVGTDARVNASGTTYHYVAFKAVASRIAVGTYTGSAGADNRNITIASGFGTPAWVVLKPAAFSIYVVEKTAVSGLTTDSSCAFDSFACTTNQIQQLITDGFQVGSAYNTNAVVYYYTAFALRAAPTAVRLVSFTATRYGDGRVRVGWTTAYEANNLGFRVYREAGGALTRITPGLVAGSALAGGGGRARAAGGGYTWWDTPPVGADPVWYYLEDVDLSGKATRYGPVTPTASDAPAPDEPNSPLLNEFASWGLGGGLASPVGAIPGGTTRHAARPASARARAAVAALRSGAPGAWPAMAEGRRTPPDPLVNRAAVRPSRRALATQQAIAAGAALKVAVREEGWYRLPYATLVAAGLPARVGPERLRLVVGGVEQPLRVNGARAGRFGPADAIEFYGTSVDTPWTDTRVYWLTWDGGAAERVPIVPASATGADGPASFPFTVEIKDRTIFFGGLVNGEAENFFGALITSEATDLPVRLAHLDPTGAGELTVTLQGVTIDPARADNHQVAVLVNGTAVGQVAFDGQAHPTERFALPAGVLVDGENVVTLAALGGEADVSLVDVVQVTYAHTYTAETNRLRFTAAGQQAVTLGGFSQAGIRVVDITDPGAVTEVRGLTSGGAGGFAVRFRVPGSGPRTLLAFAAGSAWAPAAVSANQPSAWHQAGRRADYVLVAPTAFLPALEPLATRRLAQGHAVAVVDIEDVYDEFSFGQQTPHALRDFLTRAKAAWETPPRFVTLVGNATIDPRDYLGLGEPDWVPTQIVATTALETASDDWFVDADGDGTAIGVAVGRLPARSAAETATLVAKIVGYEDAGAGPWSDAVTFVADAPDPGDMDFGAALHGLRPLVPAAYAVTQIGRGAVGTSAARAALLARLDAGQAIVNYAGHGSVQIWHDQLLTTDDPPTLGNGPRLPVYVLMTCLNGMFQGLFPEESLAEALMRAPDGGAIAAWASSGLTEPEPQLVMNAAFYRALFDRRVATLGEAVVLAKRATADADVRRTWIFFGDPALQLKGRHVAADTGSADSVQRPASGSPPTVPTVLADPSVRSQQADVGVDGGGRREPRVYRPSTGEWFTRASGPHSYARWGTAGDIPVPGDYNGDGTAEIAVFRPSSGTWYIWDQAAVPWGAEGDVPVPGDYSGDGTTQIAVFRPSNGTWYILGQAEVHWGAPTDIPVPGDFDGDGRLDLAVFRPSTGEWFIATSSSNYAPAKTWTWGTAGDQPLAADFDGDGKADLTVFQPGSGTWFTADSSTGFTTTSATQWGQAGDIPVPLDFDGDRLVDLAVYRPSTGMWFVRGQFRVQWGTSGDVPVGSPTAGPASSWFKPK